MFEHFTFGAHPQASLDDEAFPSPTDCSFQLETPPTSACEGEVTKGGISDIVNALSTQSLRPDEDEQPQRSIWNTAPLTPDFDTDQDMPEFTPEEISYISSNRGKVTLSTRPHYNSLPNLTSISNPRNGTVACRRLQRQLNVQLQSCNHHIRDITSLVEDMISTSSQCRLHPSPSTVAPTQFITEPLELDADELEVPPPVIHEDEGFAEMEDDDEMTLRRASTPSGIRKWNVVRYRASGEGLGAASWTSAESGRRKVRCVPRMRRRKPTTAVAE